MSTQESAWGAATQATEKSSSSTHVHLTAEELLEAVAAQRQSPEQVPGAVDARFFMVWGGAGLLAFALVFLRFGASGRAGGLVQALAPPAVWVLVAAALSVAIAAHGAPVVRALRRGGSRELTRLYTGAWLLTGLSVLPLLAYIGVTGPADRRAMYVLSALVYCIGLTHLFSAALWRNSVQLLYGGAICLSVMFALAAGPAWYAAVYAVAAGAGGLVAARLSRQLRHRPAFTAETSDADLAPKGRSRLKRLLP